MFAVVTAIAVLICVFQSRPKDSKQSHNEQADSRAGKEIQQDLVFASSFTNPAYTSSSDFRPEIWSIKEMQSGE